MISALSTRSNPVHANNYRKGRAWRAPLDVIVIHVTEDSAASARNWFADPDAEVSAHYLNCIDGHVEAFVDELDTAYHAGQLVDPSSALVIDRHEHGGYSPNSYGIGIENEGDGHHELTEPQRASLYALIRDIRTRHPVPLDRVHILGHHEVKKSKTCPGKISVDRIVSELVATDGAHAMGTAPRDIPAAVFSPSLGVIIPMSVKSDTLWTFATIGEIRASALAGHAPRTREAGTPLSSLSRMVPLSTLRPDAG